MSARRPSLNALVAFAALARNQAGWLHQVGAPARLTTLLYQVADETDAWARRIESTEKQQQNSNVIPFPNTKTPKMTPKKGDPTP